MADDVLEGRLRALRVATEDLALPPGFLGRLERRLEARRAPPVLALIAGRARALLAASLVVTAVGLLVVWRAERAAVDAVARAAAVEGLR